MFNDALQHILSTVILASDIWLRTILIVRKETRCRQHGLLLYRLTASVAFNYAPSFTDRINVDIPPRPLSTIQSWSYMAGYDILNNMANFIHAEDCNTYSRKLYV